jgi:hypothetical protein
MGEQQRTESLFYYFRLEDQIPNSFSGCTTIWRDKTVLMATDSFDWQTHSAPSCVSSFVNREVCKRYPFRVRR